MPVLSVVIGAVLASGLTLCITVAVRQYRQRLHIGRELAGLISQDQYDYIVLDVRDEEDYKKSHVENSENIPFSRSKGHLPTENMFERIIVFGPTHRKARLAARDLDRNGYFNATHYGAYKRWKGSKTPA